MALKLFSRRVEPEVVVAVRPPSATRPTGEYEPAEALRLDDDPMRQYLQCERFGVIAASQDRLCGQAGGEAVVRQAMDAIDELFAVVPEGFVSLPETMNDVPGCPETDVDTEPFLLARHPVTNEQFQKFVDADGYSDLELWPKDIWPHLIDFKDLTECPGPRFWRDGRYDKPLADHPVVGICYYEASAFTRWAGYRLPVEAEWQMAASWRIRSAAHVLRRYPWGDALDTRRCNIWASNISHTVPVTDFSEGAAPNGVQQLVGNVWEWTDSDFEITDDESHPIVGDMLMKSIRGGAFDTYFPVQAASTFRTGSPCVSRVHNVGFRCAMDVGK